MAHLIESSDGMVLAEKPAWHGLGTVVPNAPTAREALQLAALTWTVVQCPIYAHGSGPLDGSRIEVPDYVANVRSDTGQALAVVKDSYSVLQNSELAEIIDGVQASKRVEIESAGSLRGGRDVFFCVRLASFALLQGRDPSHVFALFVNCHDGTRALRVLTTAVRVVCANTLRAALGRGAGDGLTLRHTSGLAERVKGATNALRVAETNAQAYAELADVLARRMLSNDERKAYYRAVYEATYGKVAERPENDAEAKRAEHWSDTAAAWRALEFSETNTVPGMGGTAWQALNVLTEWSDHGRRSRLTDAHENRAEAKAYASWLGHEQNAFKSSALVHAAKLVSAR